MSTYSHGWPEEYWWPNKGAWFLYCNMQGEIVLKHPFWKGAEVLCPHCSHPLRFSEYKAECCGKHFKTGFHDCRQVEPHGAHSLTKGRGWDSLKLYRPNP